MITCSLYIFFNRTDAAYGYVIKPDDLNETRNIISNAKKHSSSRYLLNIDVKDFFHYVRWQMIYNALVSLPFNVNDKVAECICHLCTLDGRLPMGAPTSPVLSNIATYSFDKEMERYCKGEQILYSRYVDDMSFSGNEIITQRHFEQLSGIITKYGYELHPEKIKWFSGGDKKIITGLIVQQGTVAVPQEYSLEVEKEITNLKTYVLMQTRLQPRKCVDYFLSRPAQKIKGALAFIESVHGSDNENLLALQKKLEEAVQPPVEYESLHWLEIGYTF